jgi:hypothetical protein
VRCIEQHVDSVTAVLILANGTVPHRSVGTGYTFSALSAIFPKTLVNNTAFMFTNIRSPLSWNFSREMVPGPLKNAPMFLLDNPIALRKRSRGGSDMGIKDCEQGALGVLVELFDWLDDLEPRPATEIVSLYEKRQTSKPRPSTSSAGEFSIR